jgi:putative heme-binding domain-containing protein
MKLNCQQCHKVGKAGGDIGPELTEVFKRWNNSSKEVLREILEPSRTVEEKYQTHIIAKKNGERVMGYVAERHDDHLMVVVNPLNPVAQRVDVKDIATDKTSKQSPMPEGLLNFLQREEILDLLAFLQSGGDESHAVFKHHH